MRKILFILVGIIIGCFAVYFFSCEPGQVFKFKVPGSSVKVSTPKHLKT